MVATNSPSVSIRRRPSQVSTGKCSPRPIHGGLVKILHGCADGLFDGLIGQKLLPVKAALVDAFNIPPDAVAFVNGKLAGSRYRLQPNDVLEFVKRSCWKRHDDDLLTPDELKAWRRGTDAQYEELLRRGLPTVRGRDGLLRHPRGEVHQWFAIVPPGAPAWVKGDRIAETIRVWQPRYWKLLSPQDALEILVNTRNLLDVFFPLKKAATEDGQ